MVDSADNLASLPKAARVPPRWRPLSRLLVGSLSARLLVLTILFVLVSEVLIYVPSIAHFRETWLEDRLNTAVIASLAVEAAGGKKLPGQLSTELLARAGVIAMSVKRPASSELVLGFERGTIPDASYDLERSGMLDLIAQAIETLAVSHNRVIHVSGQPEMAPNEIVDIVIGEKALRHAMLAFSWRILGLSIVISLITASLVYLSLHRAMVQPMRRLTANMLAFRDKPENAEALMVPSGRVDEVGQAEFALAEMQRDLRAALNQKSRLAALGAAVSKINHDLRNILASAQLFSERFVASNDPVVQRELPKLMGAIDRAIDLATNTLRYGQADERPPRRKRFGLASLVDEVASALPHAAGHALKIDNKIEREMVVCADPDQLYRVLLNLSRNAAEAMARAGRGGSVCIGAATSARELFIDVEDDGPGIVPAVADRLFEAFSGSRANGGSGLGLAISRELVRGHGGELSLLHTGRGGTAFRLIIPQNYDP